MYESPDPGSTRRKVLALLGIAAAGGIGVNLLSDKEREGRDQITAVHSTESSDTDTTDDDQDQVPPELSMKVSPTASSGELKVLLEAQDDNKLQNLVVEINGVLAREKKISAANQASIDTLITDENTAAVQPFEINTVTGSGRDQYDNKTKKAVNQYVRKYDKMEDTRLEIGSVYIPFVGDGFEGQQCIDEEVNAQPSVGEYGLPIPPDITSRHIDQMTGHGINSILFDYEGRQRSNQHLLKFLESELVNQVELAPKYGKGALTRNTDRSWKNDVLPEDLGFVRDKILTRDNVATMDGQPVFSTWGFHAFAHGELRDKVMEEYGSYQDFVGDMRSLLRVGGKEPFLVISKGSISDLRDDSEYGELIQQFDAATTWMPGSVMEPNKTISWKEAIKSTKNYFAKTRTFTDSHDMEFIPMVYPGYDERGNTCYGSDRHIPRSVDRFKQMLELADKYRSTKRINIATWNDWVEGHQIEPGKFRRKDYGTEYLKEVKKFQQFKN